ncbi:MAG: hypothetical protein L0Z70_15685 [Chloroflexi bacterium]|nr:hypothetical protein [Chloroflexota bacterium]
MNTIHLKSALALLLVTALALAGAALTLAAADAASSSAGMILQPAAPDFGLSYIVAPAKTWLGATYTYTIVIENWGTASINTTMSDLLPPQVGYLFGSLSCTSGVTCSYDAAGPNGPEVFWQGSIAASSEVSISFAVQPYEYGMIVNRAKISDTSLAAPMFLETVTGVVPDLYYQWDFEFDDGGFTANPIPGEWAWGEVGPGPHPFHSGPKVWATDIFGDYDPGVTSLLTKTVDLTWMTPGYGLTLQWWEWYDINPDGDWGAFYINGAPVYSINGSWMAWSHREIDLTPWLGQVITLAWELSANNDALVGMGWYLDDVSIHSAAPTADLNLSMFAYPEPALVSETITYELAVMNFGPVTATMVELVDYLPQGVTPLTATANNGYCWFPGSDMVQCNISFLPPGDSVLATVQVLPNPADPNFSDFLTNYAEVWGYQLDPWPGDNAAVAFTTLWTAPPSGPWVDKIYPNYGYNTSPTYVTIDGGNFSADMAATLSAFPLISVTVMDNAHLSAIVPAGLPTGTLDLWVLDALNGQTGYLPGAFTVLEEAPAQLYSVWPDRGLNDTPILLDIWGANIPPAGISLTLSNGANVIPLEGLLYADSSHLQAVAPAGVSPGLYDLNLHIAGGSAVSLPAAYTALDPAASDDLYAKPDYDFWFDPPTLRQGVTATIGLKLRRLGGVGDLATVAVDFYAEPGGYLGRAQSGALPPRDVTTASLTLLPLSAGVYTLTAVIDPDNLVAELDEGNNTLARRVVVLPPPAGDLPVEILALQINGGAPNVNRRQVNVEALLSRLNGHVFFIEYIFSQALNAWLPAAASGWLPYAGLGDVYTWTLQPVPGAHYIQAWAANAAGDIAPQPALALTNLLPPAGHLSTAEVHLYRYKLNAGREMLARLVSLLGDADLYAFAPDGALIASLETLDMIETITFTAAAQGTYQIEVEGATSADYHLEAEPGPPAAALLQPLIPDKGRIHPFGGGEPEEQVALPEAPRAVHTLFLPQIQG